MFVTRMNSGFMSLSVSAIQEKYENMDRNCWEKWMARLLRGSSRMMMYCSI